jgi:hypothetical protein
MKVANNLIFSTAIVALAATSSFGYAGQLQNVQFASARNNGTAMPVPSPANNNDVDAEAWSAAIKRLAFLGDLEDDHDGEGALAPDPDSIDTAILFLRQLPFYSSDPLVGVDADGNAVVEFHDDGEIGQIVFHGDRTAEAFYSRQDVSPVAFEGSIDSLDFADKFLQSFGFRFSA